MNYTHPDHIFVIAEIGVNHNGSLERAKDMIEAAKESGADAVKFQTFSAQRLAHHLTPKAKYQKRAASREDESHFEMLKSLELSESDHLALWEYASSRGIVFISTPYDVLSARFLQEVIGVSFFKVASADIVDLELHKYLAGTGKHIFVSTGMSCLGEIEHVVNIYRSSSPKLENLTLLHCTSNYPCSLESINLLAINTLRSAFNVPVGFSDHSSSNEAAIMSVALGASVVEKHFTLDKNSHGPDHQASMEPTELSNYIRSIRNASRALGSARKYCHDDEIDMRTVSRKSIFIKKRIEENEAITSEHLCLMRPGNGISPVFLSKLIGCKVSRSLEPGTQLCFDHISLP